MPFATPSLPSFILETIEYIYSSGHYENGQWIIDTSDVQEISGAIFPLTEKELSQDVNGTYTRMHYKVYVYTELEISQKIRHNGIDYEIMEKLDYITETNFRRYIVRRVGVVDE